MEEQSITVKIAERSYKLKVNPEDEEIFREATKLINDRLKAYSSNFSFNDNQDLFAMVTLQYTTSSLKKERLLSFHNNELADKLLKLNNLLG